MQVYAQYYSSSMKFLCAPTFGSRRFILNGVLTCLKVVSSSITPTRIIYVSPKNLFGGPCFGSLTSHEEGPYFLMPTHDADVPQRIVPSYALRGCSARADFSYQPLGRPMREPYHLNVSFTLEILSLEVSLPSLQSMPHSQRSVQHLL